MADVLRVKLSFLHFFGGRAIARLAAAIFLASSPCLHALAAADEKYPVLTIGTNSFTNVIVLTKTRTDIFLSHAAGMASLKVKDLDTQAQLTLGYIVAPPKPKKTEVLKQMVNIERIEANPEVQRAEQELVAKLDVLLEQYGDRVFYALIGIIVFSYLSFSSLCRAICVKSATPPTALLPLIWVPLLKQLPLLKAAGMSPWWILTNFFPPLSLITYIVWGFKISVARGKSQTVGVLFLLPVFNILAFLYLALSGSGKSSEATNKNVISLQSSPKRAAA